MACYAFWTYQFSRRFQIFLNTIFADLLDVFVIIYLNNILIFSVDEKSHIKHVSEVLWQLWKHGYNKKYEFHSDTVEYLGHIIGPSGICMDDYKVKVIQDWLNLRKSKTFNHFLVSLIFTGDLSMIILILWSPLTRLTQKNTPWNFISDC